MKPTGTEPGRARIRMHFDLLEELLKGNFYASAISDAPSDLKVISVDNDPTMPRTAVLTVSSAKYPDGSRFTASGARPLPPFVEVEFTKE